MATELDKLVVKIEADLSDLKKGMAKANGVVKKSSGGMSKSLTKLNSTLNRVAKGMLKVGAVAAVAFGIIGIKNVIKTGMEIQKLEIRFNNLFGSVEEGNKAFKQLLDYAGTVPFSLGEIQLGAGSLAVVSKNAEELRDIMEITGNVAVISGLDFATAAGQMQRVFSGGLAAADIFRERGITQIIKDSGLMVDSIEGAGKAFEAIFSGKGKFANATKEMAVTVEGNMSMIGDVIQQFTIAVAEGFFVKLAGGLEDFRAMLEENKEEIKAYGKEIGEGLGTAFENIGVAVDVATFALKAFIGLKIVSALRKFRDIILLTRTAVFGLNVAMSVNPIFAALTAVSLIIIFSSEIKELGAIIDKFIIRKFNEATFAIEKFLNSFKSKQSNFAAAAKLVNPGGLSGPDRMNIAFGADRESAQEAIIRREKENNARKFTKFNQAEFLKRGESERIYRAVQADLNGQAFDNEMAILEATQKARQDVMESIQKEFENIGKSISTAFGEAVVSGKDFKDSMVNIFQSVAQQVVALIFQLRVVNPLLKQIKASMGVTQTSAGSGVAGLFSSFASNSFGGFHGADMIMGGLNGASMPMQGLAGGGSVNANMPYMVGERGAEMFVPKSAGNIVNNSNLGSGGSSIVIEQNLNFSTGVAQTVRAEVLNLLPAIQESTLGAVRDARLRGGSFAKDFGG